MWRGLVAAVRKWGPIGLCVAGSGLDGRWRWSELARRGAIARSNNST